MGFISQIFNPPKPPAAPDYAGAATAQGAANVETARLEGRMNRPDVFTPYDQTVVTELPKIDFKWIILCDLNMNRKDKNKQQ